MYYWRLYTALWEKKENKTPALASLVDPSVKWKFTFSHCISPYYILFLPFFLKPFLFHLVFYLSMGRIGNPNGVGIRSTHNTCFLPIFLQLFFPLSVCISMVKWKSRIGTVSTHITYFFAVSLMPFSFPFGVYNIHFSTCECNFHFVWITCIFSTLHV